MSTNTQTRSSSEEMTDSDGQIDWVGGRQGQTSTLGGGGGYQDNCTHGGFQDGGSGGKADPRINELREMHIGRKWIQIAETIGFDNFMAMWAILDEDNIKNDGLSCDRVRIWVPVFKRYLRYQRNRYILSRAADGDASPQDLQAEIKKLLSESLSIHHIKRIMEKVTIPQ